MLRRELYSKGFQAYLRKCNQNQTLNKLNQVYFEESYELDLTFKAQDLAGADLAKPTFKEIRLG